MKFMPKNIDNPAGFCYNDAKDETEILSMIFIITYT